MSGLFDVFATKFYNVKMSQPSMWHDLPGVSYAGNCSTPDVLFFGGLGDNPTDYTATVRSYAAQSIDAIGVWPDFTRTSRGLFEFTVARATALVLNEFKRHQPDLQPHLAGISLGGAEAVQAAFYLYRRVGNVALASPAGVGSSLWGQGLATFNRRRKLSPPLPADDGQVRHDLNFGNQRLVKILKSNPLVHYITELKRLGHQVVISTPGGDTIFPAGEAIAVLHEADEYKTIMETLPQDTAPHASLSSAVGRERLVHATRLMLALIEAPDFIRMPAQAGTAPLPR